MSTRSGRHAGVGEHPSTKRNGILSVPAYFGCVLLMTALGIGAAAFLRPTFGTDLALWSGLKKRPEATPASFYAARVAPLLEDNCTGCHGHGRQKGKLRLDSFAGLWRGGKHGPVIEAGNVQASELFTRITLPADDERAMPPKGKTPLSQNDITVIRLWIAAGASGSLPVDGIKGAPEPVKKLVAPKIDTAAVARQRAPLSETVAQLQSRFPNAISYISRGSADLDVNASLLGTKFGDEDLAALAPLKGRIVWLDASHTSLTDASAQVLASMPRLHSVRLMNTEVTDTTITALASLPALRSLTIVGTNVTAGALAPLRAKGIVIYDDAKDGTK